MKKCLKSLSKYALVVLIGFAVNLFSIGMIPVAYFFVIPGLLLNYKKVDKNDFWCWLFATIFLPVTATVSFVDEANKQDGLEGIQNWFTNLGSIFED